MGNVHVSPGLDPSQRIFRPVSFYDLIELMTFSQITFGRSDQMRPGSRQASTPKHISWALLDHEDVIDWDQNNTPESTIYLVSSVGALSMSLLPDNGINIFIEQTWRVTHLPDCLTSTQTNAHRVSVVDQGSILPILEDGTVSVIVNPPNGTIHDGLPLNHIRLLVDLGTLLTGVIVYPGASIRFVELVSRIVQRTTHAFVSRACHPCDRHFERILAAQRRSNSLT